MAGAEGGYKGNPALPSNTNPANMLSANMMSESSSGEEVSRSLASALMATTRQLDETQRQLEAHTLQLTETRKVLAREKTAAEMERQRAEQFSAQLCTADETIRNLKQQLARYEGKIQRTGDLFRTWWVEVFNDSAEASNQSPVAARIAGGTSHMLCLNESRIEGADEGNLGAMGANQAMPKHPYQPPAIGHDARRSSAEGVLQRGLVVSRGGATSMGGILPMRSAEGDATAKSLASSGVPSTLTNQGGSLITTPLCADNTRPSSSQGGISSMEKEAEGREAAASNLTKAQGIFVGSKRGRSKSGLGSSSPVPGNKKSPIGRKILDSGAELTPSTPSHQDQVDGPASQRAQSGGKKNDLPASNMKRCECGLARPSFGISGGTWRDARWCSKCPAKPHDAVNVVNKRCECGLSKASFGLPGGVGVKDARWCSKCPGKTPDAVDVTHRRCECGKAQPSFGPPGSVRKNARWCARCPAKPADAVDVVHKRCECGMAQPTYGFPKGPGGGKADARWCLKCPNRPPDATVVRANHNA